MAGIAQVRSPVPTYGFVAAGDALQFPSKAKACGRDSSRQRVAQKATWKPLLNLNGEPVICWELGVHPPPCPSVLLL